MKYSVKENLSARKCCENRHELEGKFIEKNNEKKRKSKIKSIN